MENSILYDRILRSRVIALKDSDTSFSVDINSPSKSIKGVLLLFTKERSTTKFERDTEEFNNPKITKVEVTVEGSAVELDPQNMEYSHHYDETMKHFGEGWLKDSLWVISQKYNFISKDVREQLKWLCLFFTKDGDSFEDCLRENDVVPDKKRKG